MTRKHFFIIIPLLLVLGGVLFHIIRSDSRIALVKRVFPSLAGETEAARLRLHPLASQAALEASRTQTVETWEEWIDARTEAWLGVQVLHDVLKTPAEIKAERPKIREGVKNIAELFKPLTDEIPTVGGKPPWHLLPGVTSPIFKPPKRYEGPQTVEGLMEAFDAKYVELYPATSAYDAYYSRAEWLQMLLDKGMHFENRDDYTVLLHIRGWVINAESKPEWWSTGNGGITPTDNFETYKNAYIDRQIWQQQIYKQVTTEDPTAGGVQFFDDRPDKYLVMWPNTLYVNRDGPATRFWGMGKKARLTDEQEAALIEEGIHPEGVNIIYVDNDYNILSEMPPTFDRDAFLRAHMTDAQRAEELEELEMFEKMLEIVEEKTAFPDGQFRGDGAESWRSEFDVDAVRAAAHKAAKSEFERFQDELRQLEEFATMSDAEIEKALERQFRKQFLPEHPVEQLTPERLEKALGTLYQHGFEEGFRRIRQDSPALAAQLERYLGLKRLQPPPEKPEKSERAAPPTPPQTTPPEKGTN